MISARKTRGGRLRTGAYVALLAAGIYLAVAETVFAWRHPWMTDTERVFSFWPMITFERVAHEGAGQAPGSGR